MEIDVKWTHVDTWQIWKSWLRHMFFYKLTAIMIRRRKRRSIQIQYLPSTPLIEQKERRFIIILSWPKSMNIHFITSNVRILTRPLCRTWWQGALDLYEADGENVCDCSLDFVLYHCVTGLITDMTNMLCLIF